jgi:hypothetical protein
MFLKRLYKVVCVGLVPETYSEVIDDEAEHDVARAVSKEARGIRALNISVFAQVFDQSGLTELTGLW